MDKVALGNRIREARKCHGLTQEQLADKLNIVSSYLTLIEQGKRNISIETLSALSDCLNLSTDYLLKGNQNTCNVLSISQWQSLTDGRSEQEIASALVVVREFFKAVDEH